MSSKVFSIVRQRGRLTPVSFCPQNVKIDNFSTSWNDGMAFCALIHHFYPDAFEFEKLNPKNRRYNFDLAFKTAE